MEGEWCEIIYKLAENLKLFLMYLSFFQKKYPFGYCKAPGDNS
jgi:hypothetical protein